MARRDTDPDSSGDPAVVESATDVEIADTAAQLRLSVTRLARLLRQQSDAGLSPSQMSALASISRHGPLSLGRLAEHERVAPPTITRIVTKLEEAGLVTRHVSPTDRRSAEVAITPDGTELIAEVRRQKNEWLAERLRELDPADLNHLNQALVALEALTTRPCADDGLP